MPTVENLKFEITDPTNKWVEVVGVKKNKVETVIIPSSITIRGKEYKVTSIGEDAFQGCPANIYCKATTPPSLGQNALPIYSDSKIYVPSESYNAYLIADGWKDYAEYIFPEE